MHTEILEVVEENPTVKTFKFSFNKPVKPGQFAMVWDGQGEEVPMSFSYTERIKGITVKKVGKTTGILHERKPGDVLRVRGPFGNSYPIFPKKYLLVAGGTGIASLAPAAEKIIGVGGECKVVAGFKNASEIFFVERLRKAKAPVTLATDDGSAGLKGLVTEFIGELLAKENFDFVLACGPIPMLKSLCELVADKIETYISLESVMKCGIGICDSCSLHGLTVCKDGPVFKAKTLIDKGFLVSK